MMRFERLPLLLAGLGLLGLSAAASRAEELPAPIQAAEARGAEIVGTFEAPGGLKGYAARYDGQGMALYLTPDGQHVLIGNLLDARGQDLTGPRLEELVYAPLGKEMWARMERSGWIADGSAAAPRIVYLFSDPNCPYCTRFWQQARPWVEAGRVQLRHIMVGILRADSAGKAAALLAAERPEQALHEHESAGKASTLEALAEIPPRIGERLEDNLELMNALGAMATPAIFYLDARDRLQQQQGAPDAAALAQIMGPR
ncbi:thiol:disulfide interchange protein DsbG [Azotobacter vinelandii]|uniref:thiol:disulfide interchange protein DsbG n=1 Tax=Azotobacter vinelandii TaxID=354 RepID=UPI0007744EFF|nr:thiol:disulfide interchange protein DsbG [Azotobacter vinelandii]WKN22597.1 thiol:disulfide interchange protein DsbG [Azotobacter vinelandii]